MTDPKDSDRIIAEEWPEFMSHIQARLEAGKREYGDESFRRTPSDLIGEIEQEIYDVCGWGFIAWHALRDIRKKLKSFE